MIPNRILVVDWSGGNDTGPTPRKDAIWIGDGQNAPRYVRNRIEAEDLLSAAIKESLAEGERLMIGFDFPFGYAKGFARALTGSDDPFAIWDWITARLDDTPQANTRFDLAGEMNRCVGATPFWANALKRDVPNLPRTKTGRVNPFPEHRVSETRTKGAFPCWQMAGAGSVGGQVVTGLPVLNRLRNRFSGEVAVWPFEPLERPIAFVEIWPGLVNASVKQAEARGGIRDAHQVDILARAMRQLAPDTLGAMLDVAASEEGWILGLGFEDALADAARLRPPPLSNDCFSLPPGVDWTPVDAALSLLRNHVRPVVGQEEVPLFEATGRVLAKDVVARRANPPRRNTAVDGYGFTGPLGEGDHVLPLLDGRAAAGGAYDDTVAPGKALRVLTGAALPDGVNTVVLEEDCRVGGGKVAFRGPLKAGANTRRAGEDVEADSVVLNAGRILTPGDAALAAAVGHGALQVFERLKVAVLSTGDELVEAGSKAQDTHIFDANRPMLLGLCAGWGFEIHDMGRVPDDRQSLRERLNAAASKADVILTSGGASAGDEDHVSALLRETGALREWRIALKPGRPLALGLWNETPVFGLPGNPVAALTCTLIFAHPAMRLMSGAGWHTPQGFVVPAAFEKRKKPGRREYLRARLRDGRAEVFHSEGSGRVSGLSWADGLVELPDGSVHVQPGDLVKYMPFTSFV